MALALEATYVTPMGKTTRTKRLSALDATFLDAETESSPLGIGALCMMGPGTLVGTDGSLDIAAIRARFAAATIQLPRYRQVIARTAVLGHPMWIDDVRFSLDYHVRHTRLPLPGDERQLHRLAARLLSQRLDRSRPMWLAWCVEGLANGGFALIIHAHHCLTDGAGGVGLLTALMQATPTQQVPSVPDWHAHPAPTRWSLLRDELAHRRAATMRIASSALGVFRKHHPRDAARAQQTTTASGSDVAQTDAHSTLPMVRQAIVGMGSIARAALRPRAVTPLTPAHIGAFRRFDTAMLSLADVSATAKALGCTVNDVVLTVVSGVLREFLQHRGVAPEPNGPLRALVPVNVRSRDGNDAGNQLALLLAELPTHLPTAHERLSAVRTHTQRLKQASGQVAGAALAVAVADAAASSMLRVGFWAAMRWRAFDVLVTNVRGPEVCLYLGDAPLLAAFPMVPLYERQAIGIGVFSYASVLHIGLDAEWALVPELHQLAVAFAQAFADVRALAMHSSVRNVW